jgi:hypothetical protein
MQRRALPDAPGALLVAPGALRADAEAEHRGELVNLAAMLRRVVELLHRLRLERRQELREADGGG